MNQAGSTETGTICFADVETTSLRPDRRAWEIGIIARVPVTVKHPDGPDTQETEDREHHWFIETADLDLGNADLMSLRVGGFHERHPQARLGQECPWTEVEAEADVMDEIEAITRGAHLAGAVVSFDAETLAARMRAHGICPSWHYHLCDVEALAVGYLRSSAAYGKSPSGTQCELAGSITALPWDSEALSRALGVDADDFGRHTALGDAKWARAIYDAVMGRPS